MKNRTARRSPRGLVAAIAATLVASMVAVVPRAAAAEPPIVHDGLTQATAAASCWEVIQEVPSSPSGVYWLRTPALVVPQQFYCAMGADGGGWVLVGRGREGWRREYAGVGTAAEVRNTVIGEAAFVPKQLPARTIDGLLNNTRVSDLPDGIRIRRATNTGGTSWQEGRFTITNRDRWVWTFGARHPLGTWSFDSSTGSGGLTSNFGLDNFLRRVNWTARETQGYNLGWAYGSSQAGSSAASSYVWSLTDGVTYAQPFTQVFLRPKLRTSDLSYPSIPDTGTAKSELPVLHSSIGLPTVWGVTGLADGVDSELNTEVSAFTQIGNRVYVGGNFQYVQRDAVGTGQVQQSYLAAFDVDSGAWDSGFRPVLNGRVRALAALPNGQLAVGGFFSQANGQPAGAVVALNAATGATSGTWNLGVQNLVTGGIPAVRGFDISGGFLYLSGAFTHLTGGDLTSSVYARNLARVRASDGRPDTTWNPNLNGTCVGVDVSDAGDRVYGAGYFTLSNGNPVNKAGIFSTAAGAQADPWQFVGSATDRGNFQFAIAEIGNRFYSGGSEHNVFGYDRTTKQRLYGNITLQGGDFQTMYGWGSLLFAGCHCDDYNYSDAYTWSNPGTTWTQADKIGHVGAWNAATGTFLPDFSPVIKGRKGYGAWATFVDSRDRLWIGGDFDRAVTTNSGNAWVGGYVRFALRDSTAPTTPTNLRAGAVENGQLSLSWNASTDASSPITYEVIRDDRVVASTTATTVQVPAPGVDARYFVRATDPSGNRSASTSALDVSGAPGDTSATLVADRSTWKWRWDTATLPATWNQVSFDDSSWPSGAGPIGYGSTLIGTNIAAGGFPSTRPLTIQSRHSFNVANPSTYGALTLTTYADDGVIVYLNGVEVGRRNLPTSTITQNTYATSAVRTNVAQAAPVEFAIPPGRLVAGKNTVAVQVHANYRSSPDLSFDVRLLAALAVEGPAQVPVVTVDDVTETSVALSWPADANATRFFVSRNGSPVATVTAPEFTDTGLEADTTYTYGVRAEGTDGSVSAAGTVEVTTDEAQVVQPVLIANASTWAYRWDTAALDPQWNQVAFNDDSWSRGAGPIGYGSTLVGTNIAAGGFPTTRPLTIQARHSFNVADPSAVTALKVTTYADDGVIVFVNGVEVGRRNLPTGTITQNTYATASVRTTTAQGAPIEFDVPDSLLVAGANTVAVQVHANYRSTPDLSFDLKLQGSNA